MWHMRINITIIHSVGMIIVMLILVNVPYWVALFVYDAWKAKRDRWDWLCMMRESGRYEGWAMDQYCREQNAARVAKQQAAFKAFYSRHY